MTAVTSDELGGWLDSHGAALELFARQWTDSPADVVQEAFVQLARQPQRPEDVAGWLFRVVRNGAISAGRSARRRRERERAVALDADAWFEPQPDAALDSRTVAEALQGLPDEQRETIVAHLWGGLTFPQIAEVTGTSPSTAHRRYAAGLEALRLRLGVPCPEC